MLLSSITPAIVIALATIALAIAVTLKGDSNKFSFTFCYILKEPKREKVISLIEQQKLFRILEH